MKLKKKRFIINDTYFDSEIPVECPYCGSYVTPMIKGFATINQPIIYLYHFYNDCCDKPTYALYSVNLTGRTGEFLSLYPAFEKKAPLPESLYKISPRFVELYNNCYSAEQKGYFELAGSGYRNALEILIKDFAINELHESESEVCKKKLAQAIESYTPNVRLAQSADVVRILGNDYTHYQRRYEDIDFQLLKRYLQIFIDNIDCEYLIRNPIIPTNRTIEE